MKNYTSEVPVERTISRIEQALAKAGVKNVMKDFDDGEVSALYFTLPNPTTGGLSQIRIPANIEAVMKVLKERMKRPRPETMRRLWQQAHRTAWKIMQDWTEIQLSLIELQQVEALQVFLPYMWNGEKTYYEHLKERSFRALSDGGFKMLPQGTKEG
jgi:hypothetical protein